MGNVKTRVSCFNFLGDSLPSRFLQAISKHKLGFTMFLNTNPLSFLGNINLPIFDISCLGIETTKASSKKKKSPWRVMMFALDVHGFGLGKLDSRYSFCGSNNLSFWWLDLSLPSFPFGLGMFMPQTLPQCFSRYREESRMNSGWEWDVHEEYVISFLGLLWQRNTDWVAENNSLFSQNCGR